MVTSGTVRRSFGTNFLGDSPGWYKLAVVGFLALNPLVLAVAGPFAAGWCFIGEFIFCLAMALRCYPLQQGGLLVIEAVALRLTTADAVYAETLQNVSYTLLRAIRAAEPGPTG